MSAQTRDPSGFFYHLLQVIIRRSRAGGDVLMRVWYWYISRVDRAGEIRSMNYGYAGAGAKLELPAEFEAERYPVQLYHHVAAGAPLEGRDVLEVGCGRGGGASYLAATFGPRSYTGLDICERAVSFCRGRYRQANLRFSCGDALALPFPDASFDAVVNVESSHRYLSMADFLREVHRVLRPDGRLLLADFRAVSLIEPLREQFRACGFAIVAEERITDGVLAALTLDNQRKVDLIRRLVPRFLATEAREFAGTEGTRLFASFANREREYLSFVLQKVPG